MAGKKGMKHYPKEVKMEAVCMFFEGGMTQQRSQRNSVYAAKVVLKHGQGSIVVKGLPVIRAKPIGRPREQQESEQAELERLRMENTLLKKYHAELRKEVLAKRNIGLSINIEKNTK